MRYPGCIGVGGRGGTNVGGVSGENIVAVCDVDENRAGGNFTRFSGAKKYHDFRKMLDEMDKTIDAVVVSTPDHTHFHPARQAMPGFYKEWIDACKGGPRATCDFVDYAGPLAEGVLLANAAFRAGGGFDWDAEQLKASENPKADDYIFSDFRDGWKV